MEVDRVIVENSGILAAQKSYHPESYPPTATSTLMILSPCRRKVKKCEPSMVGLRWKSKRGSDCDEVWDSPSKSCTTKGDC